MTSNSINVAVGIIVDDQNKVLLTKRSSDVHQGGLWEFPGGKIQQNEDSRAALARELNEELGLIVDDARPLIKLNYEYPDQSVFLDVWFVNAWHGQIYGHEGQIIEWTPISELSEKEFPAANETIINAVRLPPLYIISPGPAGNFNSYLGKIEECLKAGTRFLQLRCRDKLIKKNPMLVSRVVDICNSYNTNLLLNSSPTVAISYNAHGVHLSSARLLQINHRPLDYNYWVAASCHNQNELAHACRIGVDFVVVSPVRKTNSHPDSSPMGWKKFTQLAENSTVPVYALGGMQPCHLNSAWQHGAQGVAMLSGIWSSNNPGDVIRECMQMRNS